MKAVTGMQGVSLIEVLIAMLILSIGLLGVASLQLTASGANQEATMRTQALLVAESLAERMRANRQYINRTPISDPELDAATDNVYSTAANYNFANISSVTCTGDDPWWCYAFVWPNEIERCRPDIDSGGNLTDAVACTVEQLALFDAYEISVAAAAIEPSMRVTVNCRDADTTDTDDCSANSRHTIALSWLSEGLSDRADYANHYCPDLGDGLRDCVSVELVLGGRG